MQFTEASFFVKSDKKDTANVANTFVLKTDNWDDYSYKVMFYLVYIDEQGKEVDIGFVKILSLKSETRSTDVLKRTTLPSTFQALEKSLFISLGQSMDYYKNIYDLLGRNRVGTVLDALCDIAWQPQLALPFESSPAFRNALVRDNVAQRSRRFGRSWATGTKPKQDFSFTFNCILEGLEEPIITEVDFDPKDPIPGRVVGIIGRNAVGKTRYLAKLSESLAQVSRFSEDSLKVREDSFSEGRPLFTRVLAISYSAFDKFKRPKGDATVSYVYCGIRNENGAISSSHLQKSFNLNFKKVLELNRYTEWSDYIEKVLGMEFTSWKKELRQSFLAEVSEEINAFDKFSSGQEILCHLVTGLLAWIDKDSIVLFDEPETHLHPNAVANLFHVMTEILDDYNSFAMIATHSPIVIQEIPSKRVLIFRNENGSTLAEKLPSESFGESISEITRHVFDTAEVGSYYKTVLKRLLKKSDLDSVIEKFPQGLSLNAKSYLLGLSYKNNKHD